MIKVDIGINEVKVTLSERALLLDPIYLLKLINTNNSDDIKVGNVLDSTPGARVNTITIELLNPGVVEDLPNGKFNLQGGDYIYEFYESETNTLDVTGLNLLERGLLRFDTSESSTDYNGIPRCTERRSDQHHKFGKCFGHDHGRSR